MRIIPVDEHIYLVDLGLVGTGSFIASYVLKGKRAAIVESGPASTVPNLFSALEKLSVKPDDVAYVAVSHVHLDHSGGAGALLKFLPKAKLLVHKKGAPHAADPEKLWAQSKKVLGSIAARYGKPEPVPEEKIVAASDNMTFNVGSNVKLKAVETLGHASHHLAYYETQSRGVFTGDAAGIYLDEFNVVVPTTPFPFRLDMALASLNKLINLKPKLLFYSHFGKAENALGTLDSYIKQLKLWSQIAAQGIEKGENLRAVSRRILEADAALQKTAEYIRNHAVLSKTVLNQSVEGVMKFVQRYGNIFDPANNKRPCER